MALPPRRPTQPIRALPAAAAPITLAPTSVAAFVGWVGAGPVGQPTLVQSWSAFQQTFGAPGAGELAYAVYGFFQNGGQAAWIVRVAGTAPATPAALIGALAQRSGLYALEGVRQFNLLCLPDLRRLDAADHARVATAAAAYCVQRRAMLILDLPAPVVTGALAAAESWARGAASEFGAAGANVAAYWPEPVILDPTNWNAQRQVAASGMVAGVYAVSDASRGVWAAPAGSGVQLTGVVRLSAAMTDVQAGALAPLGLNPLRAFAGGGPALWRARTLAGGGAPGSEWTYVPVRRLALAIEDSLAAGLVWTVFEPNGPALWSQVTQSVAGFLQGLYRQGAFKGASPAAAYFVHCDASTTTATDIANGVIDIVVGFAPLTPAQFVVLSIVQPAGAG